MNAAFRILAIETSCDDTGVAILERVHGEQSAANGVEVRVLANQLSSQTVHAQYGGVFPTVAKREHGQMLVPLLQQAIEEMRSEKLEMSSHTSKLTTHNSLLTPAQHAHLETLLAREPELLAALIPFLGSLDSARDRQNRSPVDAIAVTRGPGLEPCLWVGINFAKALSYVWGVPIVGINHMEGHIAAARVQEMRCEEGKVNSAHLTTHYSLLITQLPQLALLISGGHTEFVISREQGTYEVIGHTRDDAVGECFDKCARMLDLPYPGGPKISMLAGEARREGLARDVVLPRPMLQSGDLDMSFSGLKTAVKVALEARRPDLSSGDEIARSDLAKVFAREIEDAITDVLVAKTRTALEQTLAKTLIVSGGVSANTHIREALAQLIEDEFPNTTPLVSPKTLATDNALMIAFASIPYVEKKHFTPLEELVADGNLRLGVEK